MLKLSCKINESIFLFNKNNPEPFMTLQLLGISYSRQAHLGFQAPENITILREKFYHHLLNEGLKNVTQWRKKKGIAHE